jgi:hypothetical protein
MCDGEKVRHAWIYGGMCEIRPPVYREEKRKEEEWKDRRKEKRKKES